MIELRSPDGGVKSRPLQALQAISGEGAASIESCPRSGRFWKLRDLQRLVTFEKLKGTFHDVVYSIEAAQIDFYPYQFEAVLKFIDSFTERLIVSDDVGLGMRRPVLSNDVVQLLTALVAGREPAV